jgi:hypothetical protein
MRAVDVAVTFKPIVKRASVSWMSIGSESPGDIIKSCVFETGASEFS